MQKSIDVVLRDTIRSFPTPFLLSAEPAFLLPWDEVRQLSEGVLGNASRDRIACYSALWEVRADRLDGPAFVGLLRDLHLGFERASLVAAALWAGDWRHIDHADGGELEQLRKNYLSLEFKEANVERLLTSGRLDPVMSADELVASTRKAELDEFDSLEEVQSLHETALSVAFQQALHLVQERECNWLAAGKAAGLTASESRVLQKRSRGTAIQKQFPAEYAAHRRKKSALRKAVEKNLHKRDIIAGPLSEASITFFLERLNGHGAIYQHRRAEVEDSGLPRPVSQAKLLKSQRKRLEAERSEHLVLEEVTFKTREVFDIAMACGMTGRRFEDVCQR